MRNVVKKRNILKRKLFFHKIMTSCIYLFNNKICKRKLFTQYKISYKIGKNYNIPLN